MSDTKPIRISSVKYLHGFKLRLRWGNGIVTPVDSASATREALGV